MPNIDYIFVSELQLKGLASKTTNLLKELLKNSVSSKAELVVYKAESKELTVFSKNTILQKGGDSKGIVNESGRVVNGLKKNGLLLDLRIQDRENEVTGEAYFSIRKNKVRIITYIDDLFVAEQRKTGPLKNVRSGPTLLTDIASCACLLIFESRKSEYEFNNILSKFKTIGQLPSIVLEPGESNDMRKQSIAKPQSLNSGSKFIFVMSSEEKLIKTKTLIMLNRFARLNSYKIVVVGKRNLLSKIIQKNRIIWVGHSQDAEIEYLFKECQIFVYLVDEECVAVTPLKRALERNKPTVTNRNELFDELVGDDIDQLIFNTDREIFDILNMYAKNPELYKNKVHWIEKSSITKGWVAFSDSLSDVVYRLDFKQPLNHAQRLQHVMISIRPEDAKRCIALNEKYVNFVKEYIVVTSKSLITDMSKIHSDFPVTIIDECIILGGNYKLFQSSTHQQKNWLLRAALINIKKLDDEFVMLDDDNLPLGAVPRSYYFGKAGRYKAYYYNNLRNWNYFTTSYDKGQNNTYKLLLKNNLERLSYSSHAPQIINKKIYTDCFYNFAKVGETMEIDEWSVYFNYAIGKYPLLFEKTIYKTLNWPGHPNDWRADYTPAESVYENYYQHLYSKTEVFEGIDVNSPKHSKLRRKQKQITPHVKTDLLMKEVKDYCISRSLTNGIAYFGTQDKFFISGLPYMLAGKPDVLIRAKIRYKVLNPKINATYTLVVNNTGGSKTIAILPIHKRIGLREYSEGVAELTFHIAEHGKHMINYSVQRNGKDIMPENNDRYDAFLYGCDYSQSLTDQLNK